MRAHTDSASASVRNSMKPKPLVRCSMKAQMIMGPLRSGSIRLAAVMAWLGLGLGLGLGLRLGLGFRVRVGV